MKKTLLLLFVCLFGALSGVKAYTTKDLTDAGWTEVSAISNDASNENYVGNFVYVLVDAGSSNYVLSGEVVAHPWDFYPVTTPSYRTLRNPITNKSDVWTLEVRNDGFAMCNVESKDYYNSTDNNHDKNGCWNYMATNEYSNGSFTFTFNQSEEKYSINGVQATGGYVGPWSGTVSNAGATAANKEGADAPGFFIYRMAKATYLQNYLKQVPNLTSPVDASYLIVNPTIYQGGAATDLPWGWNTFGNHDTDDNKYTEGTGNTTLRAHKKTSGNYTFDFDYYCAISNLPGGNYKVKTSGYGSPTRVKSYLYINNSNSAHKISQELSEGSPAKDYETAFLSVSTGESITLGVEAEGKHDAGGSSHTSEAFADDFRLTTDPYLSTMAAELPANGAMTAGLWYHFTVANTGNHILTATNLNDIIYATGSETALSAAGSSKFSALQNLEAGDYYVRSSSANTLTVTSCISSVATALPANGAMTVVGKWYYFDVATAGHYDFVASSLGNIVYTTNGDLPEDAIVGNQFSVKDNDLSAVRYYVKSSSAQTLQWFLTDQQNYNSRMSNNVDDWTGVGQQTPKQAYGEGVETYNSNDVGFNVGNVLYQTINDLPNGNYEVSFYAWENFCDWNPQATIAYGNGIAQVFANAATKDIEVINSRNSSGWDANEHTLNCHVTNGTLTYGVKNIATGGNWAVCRAISLTYTGPYNEVVESGETQTYEGAFTENVVVTPTAEYPIVNISGAEFTGTLTADFGSEANGFIIATAAQKAALGDVKNVVVGNTCENFVLTDGVKAIIPDALTHADNATYSRAIGESTNFGTICVPFALTSNGDIQYYTTDQITGGVLKLTEVETVAAGVPAIFKKKNGEATQITASNTNATVTSNAGSQGESIQLVGKFERYVVGDEDGTTGTAANGNYYIGADNKFYEGADYIIVNPFRAYLETTGSPARLTIRTDEETAINELKTLDEKQGLKDGKYLIGGKIVVVKDGHQFIVNGVINK